MRAVILGLAVMASVVLAASFSPGTMKTRKERRNSAQRTDEEVIGRLRNVMQFRSYQPKPKRNFDHSLHIPVCTKDQCTKQSMNMSRMMDKAANPCTDFYEYACGGWMAEGLPDDHAKWTIFSFLAEKTENKLRSLIEGQKDSANSVGKLVYNWYASCTDQNERDSLGATPLLDLIHDVMGPQFTPFLANDSFGELEDWKLEDVLAVVHRTLSIFPLFSVSLDIDPRNASSPMHLSLSQAEPLLQSRDVYISKEAHALATNKAYVVLLATLTVLLGGLKNQNVSIVTMEIKEILEFEVELVKVLQNATGMKELNLAEGTAEDFQNDLPGFDWKRYFSKLTEGLGEQSISDSEIIYTWNEKYLIELIKLLNYTPKRVVANYITWTIIHNYGPYLSSEFHEAYLDFSRTAYGIKKSSPLWRRCVRGTDMSLDMGVAMLFINGSGVTKEWIHQADEMVQHIRRAFIDNLKTVTWMDTNTKKAAKEKAEAIFQQIGYPDFIMNQTELEEYFAGLKIDPKRVFQNRLRENELRMNNTLRMRGKPMNRFQWEMRPTEINAYYSPNSNKIVVPAGILRPPFYNFDYPHAENFGALGFVVGHELTHGFDSTGAMYDKDGNLADWWSKTSMANFVKREKCFVKQYSQCEVEGHHLSGRQTLGENTADNGGLKLAYKAYHKWLANKDHDSTLPNLGLTSDQLFFLSFAQIWCEKSTPNYALTDLETNVHSPGKFRVEMTLKNSADFANAFNCELGSPMNPEDKCQVW